MHCMPFNSTFQTGTMFFFSYSFGTPYTGRCRPGRVRLSNNDYQMTSIMIPGVRTLATYTGLQREGL